MEKEVLSHFLSLKNYCEKEKFKGWDIFDGLNSRLLHHLPFSKKRIIQLLWIQFFKRSPVNFRRLSGVPKEENPQGLALFLSAYCNLYHIKPEKYDLDTIEYLCERLLALQTKGWSGACWGYNFAWQARAFYQPRYTPTVVVSTFVGYALLDAFEILQKEELLQNAISIADFIVKDLNKTIIDEHKLVFSYSPLDKSIIFNASLLASKMLSRLYFYTHNDLFFQEAKKSVAACCSYQKENGAWSYGTKPYHHWVDGFHTGYNLEALHQYEKYTKDTTYNKHIEKGFDYYIKNLFLENGMAKWYDNQLYPIDINSVAQAIITCYRLEKLPQQKPFVEKILRWCFDNMRSEKGYFYFQVHKYYTNKIPFMRWSQSWMFYALSFYIRYENKKN